MEGTGGSSNGKGHLSVYSQGFTLQELMAVMAIMGVLLAICLPVAGTWIANAEYRQTARELLYVLRDARSRAITFNREHRVEIDAARNRYRVTRGNRGAHSISWDTVVHDWMTPPTPVRFASNIEYIHLNTNGTANGGTVSIQDGALSTRYEVRVTRTGRFRITAP
jgi:prepilin-type N-terminal cleavage/methylation domain-containing protein